MFDGSEYVHMDCDSAEDHPVQHQVAPSRQPVREAISSASSTTSDSEQDIAKAIHPTQSRDRRSLPAAPEPKRAEVVSSDALDPYHNFTSAGSVPVRAHELETREAPVVKSEDRMEGFVSEGSVIKRSEEFGRPTEVREAIGDDEEEKQEVDEEELAAEQARVSQLPREQLKVYSYEELTVGVSGAGDG